MEYIKEKGISPDSILDKAQFMIYGGILNRDFAFYSNSLDLKKDELRGKNILDIGAGSALFAKKAKEEDIDVTVVDPIYALEDGLQILKSENKDASRKSQEAKQIRDWLPKAVAAIGQELPFRKNQFDIAVSIFSSFFYSESEKDFRKNIEEALRVLKPGGKLYIYSIFPLKNKKDIFVMNQNDLNKSHDKLTKIFIEILKEMENQKKLRWSIKKPEIAPKGFNDHEYFCIDALENK